MLSKGERGRRRQQTGAQPRRGRQRRVEKGREAGTQGGAAAYRVRVGRSRGVGLAAKWSSSTHRRCMEHRACSCSPGWRRRGEKGREAGLNLADAVEQRVCKRPAGVEQRWQRRAPPWWPEQPKCVRRPRVLVRPLHQGVAEVVGHERPKCASAVEDEKSGVRTKTAAAAKGFEQQRRRMRGLAPEFHIERGVVAAVVGHAPGQAWRGQRKGGRGRDKGSARSGAP